MHEIDPISALVLRLVCGVQPVQGAADDGAHDPKRNVLASLTHRTHQARQRLALDVVHDEKELTLRGDDVEGGYDVWMADARRKPRLIQEHRYELGIFRELRMKSLDGNRP
jgi:hypothetical protein